jgi:hypothetical protein
MRILVPLIALLLPVSAWCSPPPSTEYGKAPAEQVAVGITKARSFIDWALTLRTFAGAKVKDITVTEELRDRGFIELRILSPDGLTALTVLSAPSEDPTVFVHTHPSWSDRDTILLRAVERHLTSSTGDPITPLMADKARAEDDAIEQYLDRGKVEFSYDAGTVNECPWKGGCFNAMVQSKAP